MRKLVIFLWVLIGLSYGAASSDAHTTEMLSAEDAASIAEQAYIFAYPTLQNHKTLHARAVLQQKPFNLFTHRSKLLGPDFEMIVGPNNDTLYSAAWFDLRAEPLVISVPDIPETRYYSIQFIDLYTHNFAYIGQRTTGPMAGVYILAGVDQDVPKVAGVSDVFRSESDLVFAIGRILAKDEVDAVQVAKIQQKISVQPLSAYLKTAIAKEMPALNVPVYNVQQQTGSGFIESYNYFLQFMRIHPSERAMFEQFEAIGIGHGVERSIFDLPQDIQSAVERGIQSGHEKISVASKSLGKQVSGWNSAYDGFGPRNVMQGKYLTRAAAAMVALYGNDREENSSFTRHTDANGFMLDGGIARYTLTFPQGGLPPVKAFWSLTMYKMPSVLLYENEIHRYSIGDRTDGLVYSKDGSLTLYMQHQKPDGLKAANWLPVPAGPFALALRMYLPDASAKDGGWTPPQLHMVKIKEVD